MKNKRVFIGWNGSDNREIAQKVSNALSAENYSPIVGGEWRESFTVSEEIIHQMNGCDFAIILIEKETRKNKKGEIISMGLNPNVMMELGYLLHKISDHKRIRRILIDMDPSELPSDLQGAWTVTVDKEEYSTEEEREKVLSDVARYIVKDFLDYIKTAHNATDKLDYFDNWAQNAQDIFLYTGDVRIADKLLYGMQAAIYSGDFDNLYKCLTSIKETLKLNDRFNDYSAVACAMAILNVFVVTRRLTQSPTEEQFYTLCEALDCTYERDIKDNDLKAWCEIFRTDKLELCYELYADAQNDTETKIEYYYIALNLCAKVHELIEKQTNKNSDKTDLKYSLIYRAFANRNISQLHKNLIELEPHKAEEHLRLQKEYCLKTLENRRELYEYYKGNSRENFLTMDFISQEYLLALAEQHKFEEDTAKRNKIARTAKTIYTQWSDRNAIRNMIFDKVTKEAEYFLFKS